MSFFCELSSWWISFAWKYFEYWLTAKFKLMFLQFYVHRYSIKLSIHSFLPEMEFRFLKKIQIVFNNGIEILIDRNWLKWYHSKTKLWMLQLTSELTLLLTWISIKMNNPLCQPLNWNVGMQKTRKGSFSFVIVMIFIYKSIWKYRPDNFRKLLGRFCLRQQWIFLWKWFFASSISLYCAPLSEIFQYGSNFFFKYTGILSSFHRIDRHRTRSFFYLDDRQSLCCGLKIVLNLQFCI